MIDGMSAHGTPAGAGSGPDRNWAGLRDRLREIIRAEVAKLNPTDDARGPLELIVESSVRYAHVDGQLRIFVIDQHGKPRTATRDGQVVDFTIHDLLEELRLSHPVLFRPPSKTASKTDGYPAEARTEPPAAEAADRPAPREVRQEPSQELSQALSRQPSRKRESSGRDWLDVASTGPASQTRPAPSPARRFGSLSLLHLRRGGERLHGWSRKAFGTWSGSAEPSGAAGFHAARNGFPLSLDRARDLFDDLRARAPSRMGPAVAVIAVVLALGIGAFALMGRDSVPPLEADDGPETTGAVPPVQASSSAQPPAAVASSNDRILRGVPDVIDTATLSLQGEVVRLFGVEWAPGGGKPDDLARYLAGREVVCDPAGPNDTYRCQVGEQDLSRVVLFNGGGRPTSEATPELKAAAERAREARIGVWNSE